MRGRLAVLTLLPLLGAQGSESRIVDGGFESSAAGHFWGNVYGTGPGRSERTQESPHAGAWCYWLHKDCPGGGAQLMGNVPVDGLAAFRLSFWYRGGGNLGIGYSHLENGKDALTRDTTGVPAGFRIECAPAAEWTLFSRAFVIPAAYRLPGAKVRLQFQVWGGETPRDWWLDDLTLEPCEAPPEATVPPVAVRVEMPTNPPAYGPYAFVTKPQIEMRDGLVYKDGRAHFWIGNGCDLGSAQATPVGMWLAKLQGADLLALEPGSRLTVARDDGTNAVIAAKGSPGNVSWQREARRLGFWTEAPMGPGPFRWSPIKAFVGKHPDFAEHYYDAGHGVTADHGSPLGLELLTANRLAFLNCITGDTEHVVELNREPGPNPTNRRIRRAFRAWAKRKYGTLAEACRVWRREYANWEEVVPIHLDASGMAANGPGQELALKRFAKESYPEFYYDWCQFHVDDNTEGTAAEIAAIKAANPKNPVTIDVRGHRIYGDTYMAYDPVRIGEMTDLMFIHYGLDSFRYNETPWHEDTFYRQTCFPHFMYGYFRTNVKTPFVDCEDIIREARLPGSNAEAMARNDLAQLHATPWRLPSGPVSRSMVAAFRAQAPWSREGGCPGCAYQAYLPAPSSALQLKRA